MITAQDIMSEHTVVIYEDMLIKNVAHLMLRDGVSGFPVVSETVGLVGIITMTDLFKIVNQSLKQHNSDDEFFHDIDHFKNLTVSDVMSREVIFVKTETTISEILHLVVEKNVHSFPVMEGKRIAGIVGRHDILNAVFAFE